MSKEECRTILLSNGHSITVVYSGALSYGLVPWMSFWVDGVKSSGEGRVGTLYPSGLDVRPFPAEERYASFFNGLSAESAVVEFCGVPVEVKIIEHWLNDVNICIDGVFILSLSKFKTRDDPVVVPCAGQNNPTVSAIFDKLRKNAEQAQVPSVTAHVKEQDDLLEQKKRTINELEEQLMTAERALDKEKKTSEQLRKKNDGLLSALTALEQRVTTLEERLAHACGTNDV